MPRRVLLRDQTAQPLGTARLNTGNPLARGLVWFTVAPQLVGRAARSTPLGYVFQSAASVVTGPSFGIGSLSDLTLLSFGVLNGTANSGNEQAGVRISSTNVRTEAFTGNAQVRASVQYSDFTSTTIPATAHGVSVSGGVLALCLRHVRGATNGVGMFANGRLLASANAQNKTVVASAANAEAHWAQASGNQGYLTAFNGIWNRALSDAEIASLSSNPWQLFEPQQRSMSWAVPGSTRRLRLVRDAVQADHNATLNGATPYTQGLAFLTVGGSPVDLARGQVSTLPVFNKVGQVGPGLTAQSTTTAAARYATSAITTSDGAGTGDFTFAVMANVDSAAGRQGLISQDVNAGAQEQTYIVANANAALATTPGSVMFGTFATTFTAVDSAGAINGKMRTFIGVRRGTTLELWADGVLLNSVSGTIRDIHAAGSGVAVGGLYAYTGYGCSASIPFAAGWNRALSATEVRALSLNPLQMFNRTRVRGVTLSVEIALEIFSALHSHLADNTALTSDTALTVDAANHAHLADNLALSSDTALAVAAANHAQLAGNLDLSTDIALFVDAANHAHVVDNLGLTLQVALVTDAANHAHLADNLTLTPAGATIYRPTSDITVTGWVPTGATTVYETINEAVASDAEYSTSPDLTTPATLGFASMPAGTRTVRVRAARTGGAGQIRIRFLDGTGTDVGGTAWQTLTATPTTYTLTATISATATRARIEVQA